MQIGFAPVFYIPKLTEILKVTLIEYIQLSGTINESGQISGNTTHTFLDTSGEGTFIGQLSGNTLSIENSGQDTSPGHTCTYIRYMSATREETITLSARSVRILLAEMLRLVLNLLTNHWETLSPGIGILETVRAVLSKILYTFTMILEHLERHRSGGCWLLSYSMFEIRRKGNSGWG